LLTCTKLNCVYYTECRENNQNYRKLLQRLLNVIIAGGTVEMVNLLKNELSPSLAKPGGDMNTTSKVDVISIFMA